MNLICPLWRLAGRAPYECDQDKCAWWCDWAKCCAMVAIPAEISDRAHDIMQSVGGK